METLKSWIIEALRYDAWASERWDDVFLVWHNPEAIKVREHIDFARRIWLIRCTDDTVVSENRYEVISHWVQLAEDSELDTLIEYQNSKGEQFRRPLHDIVLHVINHGTYHRGHLRAIAESDGIDWPDTDLVYFFPTT
jgi:hypothetical protein